ncbi:hypothetical protein FPQ18DRAFT_402130 [Pyronema domesticum]|uniref:Uncharacterized protein n=1 Tax=Pyronema omphalodes (strain CBS 100304) TaxID=1076935 RepID=U4LJS1_PYROM|nr:hypothetical protein FPQ18DRAFT_402130 [Pyronema domesticum]CCX12882.1 Protein of unknown function [Pyronema omphalodes CBS 100304]
MFDPSNSTYLKDLLKDIMEAPSVKVTPENAIFKFYKNCTNAFKDVLQQFQGVFGKEGPYKMLSENSGRFNVWGENCGAHRRNECCSIINFEKHQI